MVNSTPIPSPRPESIQFLRAFARMYRPQAGASNAASGMAGLTPQGFC